MHKTFIKVGTVISAKIYMQRKGTIKVLAIKKAYKYITSIKS